MAGIVANLIASYIPENNKYERIWILAKTDFKLRYSATFFGFLWTLITPLFRLMIFYFVFSYLFTSNLPNYALHIFSGLIVWMLFQEATKGGMNVLKSKRYLIENIDFNPLDLYIASLLTSMMSFIANLGVYIIVSLVLGVSLTWHMIFLPLHMLNLAILIMGLLLLLSTMHVFFRDVSQFWELFLMLMFWINPIFYAKAAILEYIPSLMYLNPLAGIIVNTRDNLLNGLPPDWGLFAFDMLYALVVLAIGLLVFKKYFHLAAEKV